jgi:hypothetical protein
VSRKKEGLLLDDFGSYEGSSPHTISSGTTLKGNTNMRKLLRNALVTGAAAATTVGLAITPAHATHNKWDVNPEGPFSASSTDSQLTNRGATLRCVDVTADGDAFDAPDVHGVPDTVAEITSTVWTTCTGPFGIVFTVTQKGTWLLKADSQPGGLGTTVNGRITNIVANISGPLCTAQITGTALGSYDNNGTLTINETGSGNLTVQPGASCLGILQAGDHPTFKANFIVDPSNLTINNVPA